MKPRIPKDRQKEIARERIDILFREAGQIFAKDKQLADRYVALARRLAMKAKIPIPYPLKRRFCKHCYHYLQPGVNCRVRKRAGKVVISCLDCQKFMRIGVGKRFNYSDRGVP